MNVSKVNHSKLRIRFDSVPTSRKSPSLSVKAQDARLHLPDLPTTTIGSFPQTQEVRKYRADWKTNVSLMKPITTS